MTIDHQKVFVTMVTSGLQVAFLIVRKKRYNKEKAVNEFRGSFRVLADEFSEIQEPLDIDIDNLNNSDLIYALAFFRSAMTSYTYTLALKCA